MWNQEMTRFLNDETLTFASGQRPEIVIVKRPSGMVTMMVMRMITAIISNSNNINSRIVDMRPSLCHEDHRFESLQ